MGANLKGLAERGYPVLVRALGHVLETPGKRVRPVVTLLASSFAAHDEEVTETMATAVELLHVATLIHDDTVDDSDLRRGRATVSHLWGRNTAVLVGDYLFAASATFVCDTGNIRVIRRFAETIMELSTGELSEMDDAFNTSLTMDQYLDRIYNKTASLFTTAGESGAVLSGAPEDVVAALRSYARALGMAFQMVDDILDFQGTEAEFGKPVGNDLANGVITLPVIIAMARHPEDDSVGRLFERPEDPDLLNRAVRMVQGPEVTDAAYAVAREYGAKALHSLEALPRSPARESLEQLVHYVLKRRS